MFYVDKNGDIQEVEREYFKSDMEFNCFLWNQSYNVDISPYEEQDIKMMMFLSTLVPK